MSIYLFSICSFAIWRITHLLSKEDGPFDVVFLMRKKAGAGFFGNLLDCFYCLSIWVSLPFAIWLGHNIKEQFLLWFAYSGVVCLLEKITDRRIVHSNKKPIYSED